jgi:hypothetical protein
MYIDVLYNIAYDIDFVLVIVRYRMIRIYYVRYLIQYHDTLEQLCVPPCCAHQELRHPHQDACAAFTAALTDSVSRYGNDTSVRSSSLWGQVQSGH